MNKTQLIGRVTKTIELKKTPSGKSTCSFTLAVNRRVKTEGQPDADFITCVAWGKTAEILSQYVSKGNRLGVSGRIQTRNYESNGRTVYVTEVVVDEVEFLENKRDGSERSEKPSDERDNQNEYSSGFDISDDDLPF